MMTIKEQFISEIKERIALQKDLLKREEDSARIEGSIDALQGLLNSMDSLESEKPMNLDLEIEIEDYVEQRWQFAEDLNAAVPIYLYDMTLNELKDCARHFAQWGAEHTPLPEDTVLFNKGVEEGKRQMMEEAVEGWVAVDSDTAGNRRVTFFPKEPVRDLLTEYKYWTATRPNYESVQLNPNAFPNLKWEDEPIKVRIIIVKED